MTRLAAVATILATALALSATACVDGKTPDCSDAASQCGPDYDAYPPDSESDAPVADSSADSAQDTSPVDSATDSPADAPREAGDAGPG